MMSSQVHPSHSEDEDSMSVHSECEEKLKTSKESVREYCHSLMPDFFDERKQSEINHLKTLLAELQLDELHIVNWLENVKLYPHVRVGYELVVKCILSFQTSPATEVLKCIKELHSYLRYDLLDVYTEMFGEFLTDVKFFDETWRKYSLILNSLGREHYDDFIDQQDNVDKNSVDILFYIRQVWTVTSSYGKLCCNQLIASGVLDEICFNLEDAVKKKVLRHLDDESYFLVTSSLCILYYLALHSVVLREDITDLLRKNFNNALRGPDLAKTCLALISPCTGVKLISWNFPTEAFDMLQRDAFFTNMTSTHFHDKIRRLDALRVLLKVEGQVTFNSEYFLIFIKNNWKCVQQVQVILKQLRQILRTSNNGHKMEKQRLLLTTLKNITAHNSKPGIKTAKKVVDAIGCIDFDARAECEDDENTDEEDIEDSTDDENKMNKNKFKRKLREMGMQFSDVINLCCHWDQHDVIKSALNILKVTKLSRRSAIEDDTVRKIDAMLDDTKLSSALLTALHQWFKMAKVAITLVENIQKLPVFQNKIILKLMPFFELAIITREPKDSNGLKDLTLRTSKLICLTLKQTFTFLLFLMKLFDSEVDQQCLSEKELKTVLQNWSYALSRTNDDLGLVMFVIILMITDVHHGQHLLVYQDTIQELKQRLVTSLHLGQVTFQVYCGENEGRLGICNILLHLQRLSQNQAFRAEFPEHCLFHLQSILLQSCWTKQQEIELCLPIMYNNDQKGMEDELLSEQDLLFPLQMCAESIANAIFLKQAKNATKVLNRISCNPQGTEPAAEEATHRNQSENVEMDSPSEMEEYPNTERKRKSHTPKRKRGETDETERRTKKGKSKNGFGNTQER